MSRLEQALASLPASIDWPEPSPHMSARVVARVETSRPAPRRWVWAVVTAMAVVVALIPGTRQAVADLVVEAGIRIGVIEEIPTVGADLDLGEEISLERAHSAVAFPILVPDRLGRPEAVFLGDSEVSMVWSGTATLPAAPGTNVAVLLTQAADGEPRATKGIGPDTNLTPVIVGDVPGVWIEGPEHTFTRLDAEGNPIEETKRLAANVLLWTADGVDYRLELTGDQEEALAIAESVEER